MSENLLRHETSPYLLQHADNPVAWRPWGTAALAEARAANKPILLSVGYAACHWCHVMAHESFEDPQTAACMNDLFVNIKVDREERPDIDQLYMSALHQLGEQGGWPLTMFLTPDGEPFWGGTYFPKTPQFGRPSFVAVLKEVARIFSQEPDKVSQNREALTARLSQVPDPSARLSPDILPAVADKLVGLFDPVNGGLDGAPKFPQAAMLDLVWRAGLITGEDRFFDAVDHTLTRIARGGIYDHIGGGFSRYSVDERWLVPHFEKMLYDNAQIIELMTTAYLRKPNQPFREAIDETFDWLVREMETDGQAFAASLDADSEGEEGRFYVWDKAEIDRLLGARAEAFSTAFDVTAAGNFEGRNVLNRLADPYPLSQHEENQLLKDRGVLFRAREPRPRPARDDKVLADWNGLMISALSRAATVFGRPEFEYAAVTAYQFIADQMTRDDRLGHSWRSGKLTFPGFSSDHAAMALAALSLHELTAERAYLDDAIRFTDALETWYKADDGTYRLAASDADDVVIKMRSGLDEATPNPNGLAATVLVRLHHQTGETGYLDRADRIIRAFSADAARNPLGHASLLSALALATHALQIVVIGAAHDPAYQALIETANAVPDPHRSLIPLTPGEILGQGHPAYAKTQVGDTATAYVCRGRTCSLPVTDPAVLRTLLGFGLID